MRLTDIDTALRKKKLKPQGRTANIAESLWDASRELTYYDPVRRNTDLRTGPVPMKDIPTAAGKVARVVKKNVAGPVMDAYQTMGKVRTGEPYDASEARNFAGVGLLASMLGGPKGVTNPNELAMIKQPPLVTNAIRKVMKQEFKDRGPSTGTSLDTLYRRTMYRGEKHGRWPEVDTSGEIAPTFGHKFRTSSNLGEPLGVSASLSPTVARTFSVDAQFGPTLTSRAIPLYGAPPEDVMVNSMNEEGKQLLRESYIHAVNTVLDEDPSIGMEMLGEDKPWHILGSMTNQKEFNALQTDYLKSKGKKGILYHPERYDEHEVKMFDPKDLLHLDMRDMFGDEAVTRYDYTDKLASESAKAYSGYKFTKESAGGTSLGQLAYQDINLDDVILAHPKVQGIVARVPEKIKDVIFPGGTPFEPSQLHLAGQIHNVINDKPGAIKELLLTHMTPSKMNTILDVLSGTPGVSPKLKMSKDAIATTMRIRGMGSAREVASMLIDEDGPYRSTTAEYFTSAAMDMLQGGDSFKKSAEYAQGRIVENVLVVQGVFNTGTSVLDRRAGCGIMDKSFWHTDTPYSRKELQVLLKKNNTQFDDISFTDRLIGRKLGKQEHFKNTVVEALEDPRFNKMDGEAVNRFYAGYLVDKVGFNAYRNDMVRFRTPGTPQDFIAEKPGTNDADVEPVTDTGVVDAATELISSLSDSEFKSVWDTVKSKFKKKTPNPTDN